MPKIRVDYDYDDEDFDDEMDLPSTEKIQHRKPRFDEETSKQKKDKKRHKDYNEARKLKGKTDE